MPLGSSTVMTAQQTTSSDEASGIAHAIGRKARLCGAFALAAATVFAAGGGVYLLAKATHKLDFDNAYAEIVNDDGSTATAKGRGLFMTNPFTTASITTWNPMHREVTIRDRDSKESFNAKMTLDFMSSDYWGPPEAAGKAAVKQLFTAKAWRSYEEVNPVTHPANAAALCAVFSDALLKNLDRPDVRNAVATDCSITVIRKGYTLK